MRPSCFSASGRSSRIRNIQQLSKYLFKHKVLVLNPFVTPIREILRALAHSKLVFCENGSILFNCFLARNDQYYVFASKRSLNLSSLDYLGGGIYNEYHSQFINYIPFDSTQITHHPFSDQIEVDCAQLSYYLREGIPH